METIRRISSLIIITLLLSLKGAAAAAGSIDVVVPAIRTGVTANVVQNATANAGGPGGLLNNYIITVPTGWPFACVSFQNLSASTGFGYNMAAYTSLDMSAYNFAGSGAWTQIPVQGSKLYLVTTPPGYYVAPAKTNQLIVRLAGAGKLAIVPSYLAGTTLKVNVFVTLNTTGVCGLTDWNIVNFADIQTNILSTATSQVIGPDATYTYFNDLSTVTSCQFTINALWNAAANATLNFRIASIDTVSGYYDDRVSFTQFVNASRTNTATLSQYVSLVDHTVSAFALAAGTEQAGMIGPGLWVQYLITGTNPSYTTTFVGTCKR